MNLKQKWKCFWSLRPKANEGFTLVELIVVIAILAILAGIAVPAYNGYIDKAKRAGDETLLATVNKAFASACLANSTDVYLVDAATATMDNRAVKAVTPYNDEFLMFFEGNEDAKFQVIESLIFDADKHMFVDPATATNLTLGYGGAKITITGEQIQAMKDSSFYGEGMTSEKLLQQVDNVAVIAGGMGTIANVMETEGFITYALGALGLGSGANLSDEVDRIALNKLGLTKAEFEALSEEEKAATGYYSLTKQIQDNALILYAANQTTKLGNDAKTLLDGIDSETIKAAMNGNGTDEEKAKGMNQAALAYGMYYAYVNSDTCKEDHPELYKPTGDITALNVIAALDSEDGWFQDYMKSTQGQKDMDAYLEALGVIDQGATGNPGAVEDLLTSGFVDLNDLLTGTMGK